MKKYDVVLIGSGISCLTAAGILAKKGRSVCVLEQHYKAGGYLHCFSKFGLRFDTGSHYVGSMEKRQAFRRILDYLGAYDESLFLPLDRSGFDVIRFPSFQFEIPVGYDQLEPRLVEMFPHEKAGILGFFEKIRAAVWDFPTYSFRPDVDEEKLMTWLATPLSEVVSSLIKDEKLKSLLCAYCVLYGVHPDHVGFGFHAVVWDTFVQGAYGFAKGGDALTKKLVSTITDNGGEVKTQTPVVDLKVKNQEVSSVVLGNGEELSGDWVIAGIHPKALLKLIDASNFSPAFRRRVGGMEETVGAMGIYARCHKAPPIQANRNHYYFANEDLKSLISIQNPEDPPAMMYLTRSDRGTPHPRLGHALTIHAPMPYEWVQKWADTEHQKRPEDYHAFKTRVAERVLDDAEEKFGGVRDAIVEYDVSTPLSNVHYNRSENGSAYGIYHDISHTGVRALGPRTRVKNLVLTGQNSMFPGLMGSAISGVRTTGHLIGIKDLIEEISRASE